MIGVLSGYAIEFEIRIYRKGREDRKEEKTR